MNDPAVARYTRFFENLDRDSLLHLDEVFADDARFRDPFNDVHGRAAVRRVFEHMFENCELPRFKVDECIGDYPVYYLRWRFSHGAYGARHTIDGVSRVCFDAAGLAVEHCDYWDPAQQVYEHIPLLGRLFQALRGHLRAPQPTTGNSSEPPNTTTQG